MDDPRDDRAEREGLHRSGADVGIGVGQRQRQSRQSRVATRSCQDVDGGGANGCGRIVPQ